MAHAAPTPVLRIVEVASLCPHELHDRQRALPLVERLRQETVVINPPIVAPMHGENASSRYVVLDGANRAFAFAELGYPHAIVQVVDYADGTVALDTWHHVIDQCEPHTLLHALQGSQEYAVIAGLAPLDAQPLDGAAGTHAALATLTLRDGDSYTIIAPSAALPQRAAALCAFVAGYQSVGRLHRTADGPPLVWSHFPGAAAFVQFLPFSSGDIREAALHNALLPPGVSRHIVYGRAVRVNYPIALLRDPSRTLAEKNEALAAWVQQKLANRQVRYYAEPTYQFDE